DRGGGCARRPAGRLGDARRADGSHHVEAPGAARPPDRPGEPAGLLRSARGAARALHRGAVHGSPAPCHVDGRRLGRRGRRRDPRGAAVGTGGAALCARVARVLRSSPITAIRAAMRWWFLVLILLLAAAPPVGARTLGDARKAAWL